MKFEAVLFDCDGVLVDSEPITNGVLRDLLEESGWRLTPAECMRFFIGKAVRDERAIIELRTGQPLTEDWMAEFYSRRNRELQAAYSLFPYIAGTHMPASFGHLEGYGSGYYTYMWSLVIAKDLFTAFNKGNNALDGAGGNDAWLAE